MKKIINFVFVASLMFAAHSALAEGNAQKEMTVQGMMDMADSQGTKSTTTMLLLSAGHYFKPQLVGTFNLGMIGNDDGTNSTLINTYGIGGKYYFKQGVKGATVPFVTGHIDLLLGAMSGPSYYATITGSGLYGGIGIAQFISEQVSGDLTIYSYSQSQTIDSTVSSYSSSVTGIQILLGITARF